MCNQSSDFSVNPDSLAVMFEHRVAYCYVVTCSDRRQKMLWDLIFQFNSPLLALGLLAVNLNDRIVIWQEGKPADLSRVTGQSETLVEICMCSGLYI